MENFKIELGTFVKDIVTGFAGTVMGRTEYFTGCKTYGVQPVMGQDGKCPDWIWFDECRLAVVGDKAKLNPIDNPGGPQVYPPNVN